MCGGVVSRHGRSPERVMRKLPLGEIEAGSVVARPVVTGTGVVLVRPGSPLTPELLARLDALHIDAVWLEGSSPDAKPLEVLLGELEARFAGHEGDDLMSDLKAVVAARLRQEAGERHDG